MTETGFHTCTYTCPRAAECRLKKKCHILTTSCPLPFPITVMYQCPAEGRDASGHKIEVGITIGQAA